MERLKFIFTTFSVVFLFALVSNAQNDSANTGAQPEAPAQEAPAGDTKAEEDQKMDQGKMDHSKMDHGKDCNCKECRRGKKSAWKWKTNTDVRVNQHFSGNDDVTALNTFFVRGMLSGKANVDDTFYSKISLYGLSGSSSGEDSVNLYQAWVKWAPDEMFRVKAGLLDTSFFGYTDLYKERPDTLKGATLKLKTDYAHISALYARWRDSTYYSTTDETGQPVGGDTDTQLDYYGLNVKVAQLPEFVSKIKLSYYLQAGVGDEDARSTLSIEGTDTDPVSLADRARQIHMFGGLVKAGLEGFNIKGKFFWQQGEDDHQANVVHAKASYTAAEALNATVWGGYHRDSQDFQPFFYNQHKLAGYGDILALGNLTYFDFGLKVTPTDGLHVGAGYHIFMKTDVDSDTNFYNRPHSWEGNEVDSGTDGNIGHELDIWAKKKFKNGLSAKLRYVNFQPKEALTVEDSDNRVELRLVSRF